MTEVIAFPDVEGLLVTHLSAELTARAAGAEVATRVPTPRPTRLVRIRRAGGIRRNISTDSPMVTIDCWEADSVEAAELARLVRALVWAMPGLDDLPGGAWVYRCVEFGGPVNLPDPDTAHPRYQFSVALDLRGAAI